MTPLSEQIIAFKQEFSNKFPESSREIMRQATQYLKDQQIEQRALKVGQKFPEFSLPNAKGQLVSLATLLALGPVIISFYRGIWCPYCNLELRAYQQLLPQIKAKKAQFIAISPQAPDHSLSQIEKELLEFDVLTDQNNQLAKKLGLVFTLSEELQEIYQEFNVSIPEYNQGEHWELPMPATFIIHPDYRIDFAFVNADHTARAEPNEVIAQL